MLVCAKYKTRKKCFMLGLWETHTTPSPVQNATQSVSSLPSPSLPVRNCFRVSSRGRSKAHPYSLQANDSFSKQQWITCLRQAIVHARDEMDSQPQHSDTALYHIADLSLSSNADMADHTGRWLLWSWGGLWTFMRFIIENILFVPAMLDCDCGKLCFWDSITECRFTV